MSHYVSPDVTQLQWNVCPDYTATLANLPHSNILKQILKDATQLSGNLVRTLWKGSDNEAEILVKKISYLIL